MDKELETWYDNQFELFNTPGWKDFVAKVEEMFETYNEVEPITSADQLYRHKGMLEILRWVAEWEGMVNRTFEDLNGK